MGKYDYGKAAAGGLSGAVTGSMFGPVGTAVGGVVGFTAGLFGSKKKKKKKAKPVSTLDPMQQKLNEQQHQSILGEGPLADLYNYNPEQANSVFDKTIANPAYRGFKEKLAPSITGQFRSQGLQNSSYVGEALSNAGRDVQESLDAQRSQYLYGKEQEAQSSKRSAVENLQNRQTFAYNKPSPAKPGINIDNILSSISPENIKGAMELFDNFSSPLSGGF